MASPLISTMDDAGVLAAATEPWDAVVIGAGPAGSVCAHALASSGGAMRRVLLVERSAMPRGKVCGCCLSSGGAAALESAGLASVLRDALPMDACELRVGSRAAMLAAPGFRVLGRDALDARLAAAARDAGVVVATGWSARVQADGSVRLQKVMVASEQPGAGRGRASVALHARAIIVADGLGGSSLAERPEFGWRVSARSRMGVGAALTRSPVPLPTGQMAMLCGPSGYLGLVRLPSGEIDAAASLDPAAVRRAGGPANLCAELVASVGGDADALRDAEWRGTPLLTRIRTRVEAGNVYVLGDAAGYIEPFTGEGMTWAIRSALLAAGIIEARLADRAQPGAWAMAHRHQIASDYRRCALVARCVRFPRVLRAAMAVGACLPSVLDRVASTLGPRSARMCQGART